MKSVHFIGIGGIGVSALAQWFLHKNFKVSGSNLSEEPVLEILRQKGARVFVGENKSGNVPESCELLVYTKAASEENPERLEAQKRGIKQMSYPEAVGAITKEKFTIGVSGSHGKSTTTAMAGLLLTNANLDPTVFVGTLLKEFGQTNFRAGKSKYFVLEADEWAGAFWNYYPQIIILTTIDKEHLDFYKNFAGVVAGFKKYLKNLAPNGIIIANGDDQKIREIVSKLKQNHYFYTLKSPAANKIRKVIKIPGQHNISNALAVLKLAEVLKIPEKIALQTIANYHGAWRRFEYKGELNGAPIYDDYGHHPTEVAATLAAAREKFPKKRLWCVFQPHQYQRTEFLFPEFTKAFDAADKLILLDIYGVAGREESAITAKVSSAKLAAAIFKRWKKLFPEPVEGQQKSVLHLKNIQKAAAYLQKNLQKGDACLIMGASDIWKIYDLLDLKS